MKGYIKTGPNQDEKEYNYIDFGNFVYSIFGKIVLIFIGLFVFFMGVNINFNSHYEESFAVGVSMLPTISETVNNTIWTNIVEDAVVGDIIVVNKSDVIFFDHDEENETKRVIKRLIALGGTRVDIKYNETNEAVVYINGTEMEEDYINVSQKVGTSNTNFYIGWRSYVESQTTFDYNESAGGLYIPDGYMFYLGDNRDHSTDCSDYGPQLASRTIGKVEYIGKTYATNWEAALDSLWRKIKFLIVGSVE